MGASCHALNQRRGGKADSVPDSFKPPPDLPFLLRTDSELASEFSKTIPSGQPCIRTGDDR